MQPYSFVVVFAICAAWLVLPACAFQQSTTFRRTINRSVGKLRSFDEELNKPQPGEWLAGHPEKGQTYSQYLKIRPNVLTRQRHTLYIQPIGELTPTELKIVEATNEYLGTYFNCPVKMLDAVSDSDIPATARREFPSEGDEQFLTSYILEKVLAPKLPDDAFATLAFTNKDLWPGDGWNFVFGYAALRDRVGVWSLHRFGDPTADDDAYKRCLKRTIKLATHETGHMFSMSHCTNARCNMQGSNSLTESDTQPLHLCSQCQAKTAYATGADPVERFKKLKALCEKHGFEDEVKHYESVIERLEK
ncbi:MAG: archaemetzincin [Planctomycetota bacterium]